MTEWVVRPWARYGHQRLYAETPGGTALGYLDVKTGRYHADDMSNLPLLKHAISEHLAFSEARTFTSPRPPAPGPSEAPEPRTPEELGPGSPPSWVDLSATQPGAAARERALAEREAQGWFLHGLARLSGARTQERAWRIGADGEQAVAEQLGKLGPQWHVLHAVRVGERGSDIDHVVIGPAGVFTVNAKHHPHTSIWVGGDTFMVNGQRVPYVRNSRHEADRASRLLTEQAGFPVVAVGVIAVMGAHKGYTIKKQPEDGRVVVVQRRRVSSYLQSLPVSLSSCQIDVIYDVARRSTTWHS